MLTVMKAAISSERRGTGDKEGGSGVAGFVGRLVAEKGHAAGAVAEEKHLPPMFFKGSALFRSDCPPFYADAT